MILVAILFIVFLALGMPVAFAIGISGAAFFLQNPQLPFTMIAQLPISQTQNFSMLAIPLFIFAGNLMNASGITTRLMKLSSVLTGHMRGGLAQVSVVLSTLMGGVSGSAIADASMEARVLGPDMTKRGYAPGFTANVISWTALITATIPPGVGIILYGTVGEVSIGRLFASGILVGLLMMIALMFTVWVASVRHGYSPEREHRASAREVFSSIKETIWSLLFPVLLLVGIRSGLFTPSEVGAFACLYALAVGFFYKELNLSKITKTLGDTVVDVGAIMFIIAMSGIFGYGIPYEQIPNMLTKAILGISQNKYAVMGIIFLFLIVLGMFMDGSVVILLFTPIFLPLAKAVGIDPVHFGILFCTIITMGNMTPPVGLAMYAVCSVMNISVRDYTRNMWPFFITAVIVVAILMFFPKLVLFLPNLMFA